MFLVSFVINSVLLGVGLAMDAFSVSIANGLHNPSMKSREKAKIAGVFAGFQFIMPVFGWLFVCFLLESFIMFQKWIPWIALILLLYIGGKMVYEGFSKDSKEDYEKADDEFKKKTNRGDTGSVSNSDLVIQGIATSIDALSAGFTMSNYTVSMALSGSLIIAVVTYIICKIGLKIGIKVGNDFSKKASVFGGCILIFIGVKIIVTSIFL